MVSGIRADKHSKPTYAVEMCRAHQCGIKRGDASTACALMPGRAGTCERRRPRDNRRRRREKYSEKLRRDNPLQ